PIVTYVFGFAGPSSLQQIFARAGFTPHVALTARDADVIKTYVRLGLGVGVVASMAIDPREDADLVSIDAAHLFPAHLTWTGFHQGALLRGYMYDFLQLLAPHLTKRLVDRAGNASTPGDVDAVFSDVDQPLYSGTESHKNTRYTKGRRLTEESTWASPERTESLTYPAWNVRDRCARRRGPSRRNKGGESPRRRARSSVAGILEIVETQARAVDQLRRPPIRHPQVREPVPRLA